MGGGAEAARLNLRMQKEIKLLLTDPPPFASFPLLSDDDSSSSSSTSLYSILAHVKGPEDTVYAHGIFKINIQIPERYPFQPPIVTFATPVYHPNIDTGGRICLDILNLPPKGAWQPSLNISTVLTSILLLLSEPNPDDGLMCEASKEYKYNRQAFDQKARSMTEKYARAGATGNGSGSQNTENHLNPSMMETEGPDGKHNNLPMLKGKLSLESSSSNQKRVNDKLVKEAVIDNLLGNQMEGKAPFQQPAENLNTNQNNGKLPSKNRKLSLESLSRDQKISVQCKENGLSRQCSPVLKPKIDATGSTQSVLVEQDVNEYAQQSHQLHKSGDINSANATDMLPEKICFDQKRVSIEDKAAPQSLSANSSKLSFSPLPMPLNASHCDKQPQKVCVDKSGSGLPCIKHKRLGLAGRKESLGRASLLQSQEKDKENISTVCGVLLSKPGTDRSSHTKVINSNSNVFPKNRLGIRRKQPLEPLGNSNSTNDANIPLNSYHDNLNETPSKLLCVSEKSRPMQKQIQGTDDAFLEQIKNPVEVSPMPDSAIVQDSEESDEEKKVTVRPKLSLTRKRLMKKWNAKA